VVVVVVRIKVGGQGGAHRFLSSLPSSVDAGRIIALYGPSTWLGLGLGLGLG